MSTALQAFRRRKKEGRILLPRIELSQELTDNLVEAGLLGEWDTENPNAIADAIVALLERLGDNIT